MHKRKEKRQKIEMHALYWILLVIVLLCVAGLIIYFETEKRRLVQQFRESLRDVAKRAAFLAAGAIDLKKYAGKWFEVARLPNWFQSEKDCRCTTATYTALPSGEIDVLNECGPNIANRMVKSGRAVATSWLGKKDTNVSENAALRVNFLPRFLTKNSEFIKLLFGGDYWIIDVDSNYQTAIVGSPDYETLWFLSRTPQISAEQLDRMRKIATEKGYKLDKLIYSKC